MRASSTLLIFVLAAVSSTPALGAPLNTGFCERYPSGCVLARDTDSADSQALSLSSIFKVGKGIFDAGKALFDGSSNNNQQQRDFVDFEARDDVSAAFNLAMQGPGLPVAYKGPDGVWRKFGTNAPTTPPQQRDVDELFARDDESDALSLKSIFNGVKGIFDVGKDVFGGSSSGQQQQQPQRREFMELMARAASEADQSGAISFGTIFDIGKGIFDVGKDIFGGSSSQQQQQRREFIEVMARAAPDVDQSGAISFGTIFDIGKGIFDVGKDIFGGNNNQQNRRDFEELLARAATDDQSGALGLGTIFDIGKGIFDVGKTIFGGNNNQQSREFAEILARAAADDQSGALGLGTIFDIGKGIFDVGKEIFGGNNNQQSREFVEVLSRSEEGAELLRRFGLVNFHPVNTLPVSIFKSAPLSTREFSDLD